MNADRIEDVALFRYGLIHPIVTDATQGETNANPTLDYAFV